MPEYYYSEKEIDGNIRKLERQFRVISEYMLVVHFGVKPSAVVDMPDTTTWRKLRRKITDALSDLQGGLEANDDRSE